MVRRSSRHSRFPGPSHRIACLLLLPLAAGLAGCDEASPLAPAGAVVEVSVSPSQVSLNGSATVIAIGRRGDGSPLFPGTEIRFSTTRGSVTASAPTDADGRAVGIFTADGRSGIATITATAGAATDTVDVQVGLTSDQKPQLQVTANPSSITIGETATITVVARNSDGSSVGAGQTVILTTSLGSLAPTQPKTDASGVATSKLSSGSIAGQAQITALLGASDAKTATVEIRGSATAIDLQANPRTVPASGAVGDSAITLTAFVTNERGQPLQGSAVTFAAERGTLSKTLEFTGSNGVATVLLEVTQDQLSGVDLFTVRASTPRSTGDLLEDTTTIEVQ